MPATRRLILIIIILLLLLLFIVVPSVSWSQTPPPSPWQEPARELAKKILAVTGPRQTFALAVRNISSLSDSEVAAVRLALDAELRAAGLRLAAKPDAASELRITLSENVQGLLWIAEIPRDAFREVAMVSLPKTAGPPPTAATQMFVLQSNLIYEQDDPILDFELLDPSSPGTAPRLLVLEPAQLSLYQAENDRWQHVQSVSLPTLLPRSRDPRSNVISQGDEFAVFLPGMLCVGTAGKALTVKCSDEHTDVPKPSDRDLFRSATEIVPGMNFFKMKIAVVGDTAPREEKYYSSTVLQDGSSTLLVSANISGTTLVFSPSTSREPVTTFTGWGSELTSIRSPCGRGSQLLFTRTGDWTEQDAVQAIEIRGAQAISVSTPLSFPGPVMGLWTGQSVQSANTVVRNLKTGRYEAYTLTLSCGR